MTEAVATIKGKKLDARYTLIDKLGAGGQGEVWRAHDGTRGIDVALKVVNADGREQEAWSALEHEYTIASRLDHASILKVFAPHRTGDTMVLPMELASGGDLRRLRGGGFLEIIPVLLEIAQALEHAHERGVVHRDLKPGNVLFDARGRARLADFGVAETAAGSRNLGSTPSTATTRDTNKHGFSPFTASPAQLRGEPPTEADDIYGLGALAYELLSGYPPYYPHFDKKRAIEEPVPPLVPTRQIPPLLGALVIRMLAKDPKRRPRTMREVIDELDASLNDTLTFDFEKVSQPTASSAGASSGSTASSGAALPSFFATSSPAAAAGAARAPPSPPSAADIADNKTIHLPPEPRAFEWSPASGQERRSTPDRRSTPRDGSVAPRIREPKLASDLSGVTPGKPAITSEQAAVANNETVEWPGPGASDAESSSPRSPTPGRSGADALARIDAALARAAALAAESPSVRATPPPLRDPAPDTTEVRPTSRASSASQIPSAWQEEAASSQGTAQGATAWRDPGTSQGQDTAQGSGSHSTQPPAFKPQPAPIEVSIFDAAIPASPVRPMSARQSPLHSSFGEITLDGLPRVARLEPIKPTRWPWVLMGILAGAAAAVYFWLPRFDLQSLPPEVSAVIAPIQAALNSDQPSPVATSGADANTPSSGGVAEAHASTAATSNSQGDEQQFRAMRQTFDSRLAALESHGAGVWGGREFSMAKTRAAESIGARDAGNARLAQDRLTSALKLLDSVEAKAPQALQTQVAAGEKALGSGQQEVAGQAFDLARRIDPNDRRASDGLRRAQNLNGVLPMLADAHNAEAAHDYARASQNYGQVLSLDPGNATAKAGQARANAAFGDDNYAKAVGAGFAALGAGRLDEAHDAFVKARALKPNGAEASDGLRRVQAAVAAKGFASVRARASELESQERWDEAQQEYENVLRTDPSLGFAQEGNARSASRADLSIRLQQLIDRPDRLSVPGVREDARALLETAQAQSPQGPILRSQIARLGSLLPGFDQPVHLSLVSDNSTQVAIWSVGSFGSFSRRDIELKPGKYTVVGTRNGFRDVRREITVAPGQDIQTIKVTCSEPI